MTRLPRGRTVQAVSIPTKRPRAARGRDHAAIPWLEWLESRVVLSTITWNSTQYANGGSWDVGGDWNGGNVPGPHDIAEIKGLASGASVYLDSDLDDSVAGLITDNSFSLDIVNGSLSLAVGSSSTVGGPFTVEAGASLNVGAAATLTVSTSKMTVAGSALFSSGDTIAMGYGSAMSVTGSLTISGTTITNGGGGANIDIGSTGTITAADSTFIAPLDVPINDVASLPGNTSFGTVNIEDQIFSGGPLTLPSLPGSSFKYDFPGGFTVASGGSISLAANVPCTVSGTMTVDGSLTLENGDVVTVTYGAQIAVSDALYSTGATINNNGGGAKITISSPGTIGTSNTSFNIPLYVPDYDVASLAGNTSFSTVYITAATLSNAALTLNALPGSSFSYDFPSGFTVASTGVLTLAPSVKCTVTGTLSVAGAMYLASGDVVTVAYGANISVSDKLYSDGATINNDGGGAKLTISSPGVITGTDNSFNIPLYVPYGDVTSLAGNTSFDTVFIAAATLSGPLTLNQLPGSSFSYDFPNGFTVASGGNLALAANVPCIVSGSLNVAGSLMLASGDVVTVAYGASISVTDSLDAVGTTINNDGGGAKLTITSPGTIGGSNNSFNIPLYVPYTDVTSLAGNTSFETVYIAAATLAGETLPLNLLPGSNFSYDFPNGFTVASTGGLSLAASVKCSVSGSLGVAGPLSLASGDVFTVNYGATVSVSSTLYSVGATFNNGGGGAKLTITSTGSIGGSNNLFNIPLYVPWNDVSALPGNISFDTVYISDATLSNGSLTLYPLPGASFGYDFPGGFTFAQDTSLIVEPSVPCSVSGTLNVGGSMSLASGDVFTVNYAGSVAVSGSFSAIGTTIKNGGGGAKITITGTISGSGNSYMIPLYVPYGDVSSLAGNTSFDQIEIIAGTMQAGQSLSLDSIGTTTGSLSYVFAGAFTIGSQATVAVGPNVAVTIESGSPFNDQGTLSFSNGDLVTVGGDDTSIDVTGLLTASGTTFANGGGGNMVVNAGGTLTANNETAFNLASLTLNSGASASLTTDSLSGVFYINSNTEINVTGNDFSKLNTSDGVVASGDPNADIELIGNYWGTTVDTAIEAIIKDKSPQNPNLPTVIFSPYVSGASGTKADPVSVGYSTSSQMVNLTANIANTAGDDISGGNETFSVYDGTTQIGQTTSPVEVENGTATASFAIPPAEPEGTYTIDDSYSGSSTYLPSTDESQFLTITAATTSTSVTNASATYDDNNDQLIPLTATISSQGGTVGEGMVTFTVYRGGTVVGSSVSAPVMNNVASASYDLIAGTAGGSYEIAAVYTDPANFQTSTGTNTLTVSAAATTVAPESTETNYSSIISEPVTLTADVNSTAGIVNQGDVQFTVVTQSGTSIESPIYTQVMNGVASVVSSLPPETSIGNYVIEAVYLGTASYQASPEASSALTVSQAGTVTTAASVTVPYSTTAQYVPLSATVTEEGFDVDDGMVTFTVFSGATQLGNSVSAEVSNGTATASYLLPAGTAYGAYVIQASFTGTTDEASSTDSTHYIEVVQPPPYKLVLENVLSPNASAGQPFSIEPVIYEEDENGDIETGDNSTIITAAISGEPGGLQGTVAIPVVAGVATFTNLFDDKAETMTLTFSGGNLIPAVSTAITVSPGAASQLTLLAQPSTPDAAGVPFDTQPIVAEADQFGNVVITDSTSTVTASVGNLGTSTLGGSDLTVTLDDGEAVFSGLYYNKAELMNILFTSSASGVSSLLSRDVQIQPSPATQLVIGQEPSTTATAGTPFTTQPVVYVEDKYGNIETTDNSTVVSVMQYIGSGPLTGTLNETVSGGVATFMSLADTRAETTRLQFVSGTLFSPPTTAITVSPGNASAIVIATEPLATNVGEPFPTQPAVEVVDAYGNVEADDDSTQIMVSSTGRGTLLNATPVTVTDGIAIFSGLQDNTAESPSLNFTSPGLTSVVSTPITIAPGPAASLTATRKPKGVVAGIVFGLEITAYDEYGNIATGFEGPVTAALATGSGGTLSGTTEVAASNGVAEFDNLFSDVSGTIQLTASGGPNLNAPATDPIPVTSGAATQLRVSQDPSFNATAGTAFSIQPAVEELDAYGNVVTGDSTTVVTVASNGVGKLQGGSTTVTLSQGFATFSGLLDDTAETIVLNFTAPGLVAGISTEIVVSPAQVAKIVIQTPQVATTATAGMPFGTAPMIEEEDQYGNIETGDDTTSIVATLASGTGPLEGTTEVTVKGGVATFSNLVDDTAEIITLDFAIPGTNFTAGPSPAITVVAGGTGQLVITEQPSSPVPAGGAISKILVREEDAYGNPVLSDNTTVITAATVGGSAMISGVEATVRAGVATFTGLTDETAGNVQFMFTNGAGITSAPSFAVLVNPGSVAQLAIGSQPSLATAGQPITITVHETDKYGNLVTTDNGTQITASLSSGAGPLMGTLNATVTQGTVTFSNLIVQKTGVITLEFAGAGLTTGPSGAIAIAPAPASSLAITTQPPGTVPADQTFSATVTEYDSYGNIVTTDNYTQVTATLDSGAGPLLGNAPVTLVDGVATFSALADQTAETITLGFGAGKLTSGPSDGVVITPLAPQTLVLSQEPSTTTPATAGQVFATEPVVLVEDKYGNVVTTDNSGTITPTVVGGTGVLQNGEPVAIVGGIARFTNLAYDVAQVIAIRFTANGLPSIATDDFTVAPGSPAKLAISTQPSASATAGQVFATQPVVIEEDQFGNVENGDNRTVVTVSLNGGSGPLAGATSATVVGGVATFQGLADTVAETITLRFTSPGISTPAISSAIAVAPLVVYHPPPQPPMIVPTITGASIYFNLPKSKKAKKTVGGIQIDFSTSMNPATLSGGRFTLSENPKKGKKGSPTIVSVTGVISLSSTSFVVEFPSSQKFAKGGTLSISAGSGISSAAGVALDANYRITIAANLKSASL
jgi:hypothetical protein